MKLGRKLILVLFCVSAFSVLASKETPNADAKSEKGVRYRKSKALDFEALLIQGRLKRPEISVVTGRVEQGTDGLLRIREDFLDRMAIDFGETIP